jgi:hypothetical protein
MAKLKAPSCATDAAVLRIRDEIAALDAQLEQLDQMMTANRAVRLAYQHGNLQERLNDLCAAQRLLEGEVC